MYIYIHMQLCNVICHSCVDAFGMEMQWHEDFLLDPSWSLWCQGLNSHGFSMVMVINPIVGFYIPIIRTPTHMSMSCVIWMIVARHLHWTYTWMDCVWLYCCSPKPVILVQLICLIFQLLWVSSDLLDEPLVTTPAPYIRLHYRYGHLSCRGQCCWAYTGVVYTLDGGGLKTRYVA